MFEIEIDTSECERVWADAMQRFHADVAESVAIACLDGAAEAVNTHIYENRTGQLTGSIRGDEAFQITPDGAEGQITAYMEYASYVNEWEEGQLGDAMGFMDRAADKAERVLEAGIEVNAASLEHNFNSA